MSEKKKMIDFYDFHKPALLDGDYKVNVSHELEIDGVEKAKLKGSIKDQNISFAVSGPKFDLDTSLVHSVYPPAGGRGDYLAVLPTLVLNRSTLPWERKPEESMSDDKSASWLFLLLIDEDEMHKGIEQNSIKIDDQFPISINAKEKGRVPSKANYLELDKPLLDLLPSLEELNYLSYARIKEGEEEKALILCNRLPQKGKNSTVYLVSLENCYLDSKFTGNNVPTNKVDSKKCIPYLYKWQFHTFDDELYCVTETVSEKIFATLPDIQGTDLSPIKDTVYKNKESFDNALDDLNISVPNKKIIQTIAKLPGTNFHELLTHLPGGFKPLSLNSESKGIEKTGTINLAYNKIDKVKNGTLPFYTSADYRGPLAASHISDIDDHFPFNSDNTIPKHPGSLILNNGKDEDLTYAAAYELGRLTALYDVDFSTEFYKWKDETAKAKRIEYLKSIGGYKNILHLPLTDTPQANNIPKHVMDKFNSWKLLKGIPYRYLLPDPELLPNESIRFFQVDNNWINAFICGAFSIGHTVEADLTSDLKKLFQTDIVSGFLIDSLVVKAWPGYEVDVYDQMFDTSSKTFPDPTIPVRKDNLDSSIQIYLYPNSIRQLNFHLHPGKMHSGFLMEDGRYLKAKKETNIEDLPPNHIAAVVDNFVVDILQLKSDLEVDSSSKFAAEMMEGTPTVVFTIKEH